MIPKRPTTAPAAHIHLGTSDIWSITFHTDSGTASAESMVGRQVVDRQLKCRFCESVRNKSAVYGWEVHIEGQTD
jgi:hypothetical protein